MKINLPKSVIMCRYELTTCWQNFTEIYLTWVKISQKVLGSTFLTHTVQLGIWRDVDSDGRTHMSCRRIKRRLAIARGCRALKKSSRYAENERICSRQASKTSEAKISRGKAACWRWPPYHGFWTECHQNNENTSPSTWSAPAAPTTITRMADEWRQWTATMAWFTLSSFVNFQPFQAQIQL